MMFAVLGNFLNMMLLTTFVAPLVIQASLSPWCLPAGPEDLDTKRNNAKAKFASKQDTANNIRGKTNPKQNVAAGSNSKNDNSKAKGLGAALMDCFMGMIGGWKKGKNPLAGGLNRKQIAGKM